MTWLKLWLKLSPRPPKEIYMNTQVLIEKITKALAFKYPSDKMVPGITIAYLKDGQFYVSLVRHCPNKKVIVKTRNAQLKDALKEVAAQLLGLEDAGVKSPVDELAETLFDGNPYDPRDSFPAYESMNDDEFDSWGM